MSPVILNRYLSVVVAAEPGLLHNRTTIGEAIGEFSVNMKYRREIDGLRAVAVAPVMLFHAGVPGFSGGFVGVDIFFVISGYLITTILLAELQEDRFSLLKFYERRARRILPALVFVVLCCIPFAWAWMLPSQLEEFSRSVVSVAFFVSNILFWQESGYFAPAVELKPLLHTWSLAVEEQYYIFFPLGLLAIWRFSRKLLLPALAASIIASLSLAEWGSAHTPIAAFYLAPTRFWEILTGSVCAILLRNYRLPESEIGGWAGIGLVLSSFIWFTADTPTPGVWTLVPVGGTALIILFARAGASSSRLLGLPPFVGIGLISYSAYLWHQPLLAFARLREGGELGMGLVCLLLAITLVLAWFSWRFIERPFRHPPPVGLTQKRIFQLSFASLSALIAGGAMILAMEGAPWRRSPSGEFFQRLAQLEMVREANTGMDASCDTRTMTLSAKCRVGDNPSVVLWGDSYAMHLVQALTSSATKADLRQHTQSSCGPFIGVEIVYRPRPQDSCIKFNDAVLDWLIADSTVRTVVISSTFGQPEFSLRLRGGKVIDDAAIIRDEMRRSLIETSARLKQHGKSLVIVSPPPATGKDIGLCYMQSKIMGRQTAHCDFSTSDRSKIDQDAHRFLAALEDDIPVIWLDRLLCRGDVCSASIDGTSIYRDSGHLTPAGSALLGRTYDLMGQVLDATLQPHVRIPSQSTDASRAASGRTYSKREAILGR